MTLNELVGMEEKFRKDVLLVFTARSEKLIQETLSDLNLNSFQIEKDLKYESWKMGLVDNNPRFYLIKSNSLMRSEGITFQNIADQMPKIINFLNEY